MSANSIGHSRQPYACISGIYVEGDRDLLMVEFIIFVLPETCTLEIQRARLKACNCSKALVVAFEGVK